MLAALARRFQRLRRSQVQLVATVLVGLALDACGGQQYDALTLRVQAAEPRHSLGIGGTMAYSGHCRPAGRLPAPDA